MTESGVTEPVSKPTDWVSSLVIARKPSGSLLVCLDPRNLSKEIKRHHHSVPTTEEILAQMTNAKFSLSWTHGVDLINIQTGISRVGYF